jgi:hypothetical protein
MTGPARLPLIGAASALLAFAVLQVWAAVLAGALEYPLDDVYIHLAMAEGIAQGTYGVNPGEAASASSSALWPLLIAPFAGTAAQVWLPFLWNLVTVTGCGALWGRVIGQSVPRGALAVVLAALGPVALNMPGVAFTGMENGLHALMALGVVLGLGRALTGGGIAPWFAAAIILGPLVRLEGIALSLAACLALLLSGQARAAVLLALGALAGVAAFATFLVAQGLDPLPGSVLAKVGLAAGGQGALMQNLGQPQGWLLLALSVLAGGVALAHRGVPGLFLGAFALTGFAHLAFAQVGWMHRYEHYIVVALVAALLLAGPALAPPLARRMPALAAIACLAAGAAFLPKLLTWYILSPRTIHLQQAQMARFARDFLPLPVAVNDLGHVAFGNSAYVLDLWGLGSAETRALRLSGQTPPGWADPLARQHGVAYAVIYDSWFGTAVGPDWVRMAELHLDGPHGPIGDTVVTFYALGRDMVQPMRTALDGFAPTLPEGARLFSVEVF